MNQDQEPLKRLGRYSGPGTLILISLADNPKHGYALTKDIEGFAGIRLSPGTLYEALARLEGQRLIEALPADDRRRPYRLTGYGVQTIQRLLDNQQRVTQLGLSRLAALPIAIEK